MVASKFPIMKKKRGVSGVAQRYLAAIESAAHDQPAISPSRSKSSHKTAKTACCESSRDSPLPTHADGRPQDTSLDLTTPESLHKTERNHEDRGGFFPRRGGTNQHPVNLRSTRSDEVPRTSSTRNNNFQRAVSNSYMEHQTSAEEGSTSDSFVPQPTILTARRLIYSQQDHPLRNHLDDEDDDDDGVTDESSSHEVVTVHRQRQQQQQQQWTNDHNNAFNSLEKGLEIILGNSWASCNAGGMLSDDNNEEQEELRRTEEVRRLWAQRRAKAAANKQASQTRNHTGGVHNNNHNSRNNNKTLPPWKRSALTLAANRSDVTGASTEIATNRATDLALKRIRSHQRAAAAVSLEQHKNSLSAAVASKKTHREMARSLLSESSNETSTPDAAAAAAARPPQRQQQQQQQFKLRGKLGQHVERSSRANEPFFLQDAESTSASNQSKSMSSSVGVEIDRKSGRTERTKSTLKALVGRRQHIAGKASQQPSVASVPEEEHDDGDDAGSLLLPKLSPVKRPGTNEQPPKTALGPVQKRKDRGN